MKRFNWTQLGLFLESNLPTRLSPKAKVKKVSKSKPIRKKREPKGVTLAPGELDDDVNF